MAEIAVTEGGQADSRPPKSSLRFDRVGKPVWLNPKAEHKRHSVSFSSPPTEGRAKPEDAKESAHNMKDAGWRPGLQYVQEEAVPVPQQRQGREHHTRHVRRPTPARQMREPDAPGDRTTPSVATIDHTYDDMPALLDNSDSEESDDASEDEAEKEESNTGWEKKNHWNAAAAGPSAAPAGDAGGHRAPMNGNRSVTCGQAPLDAKKDAPSRSWTLEQMARQQQDGKPDYPVSDRRWDEVTASGRAAGYYPSDRVPLPNVKMGSTHTCTRCQSVVEGEQETEETCSSCQAEKEAEAQRGSELAQVQNRQWWQMTKDTSETENSSQVQHVAQVATILLMAQTVHNAGTSEALQFQEDNQLGTAPVRFNHTPDHNVLWTESLQTGLQPLSITAKISNSNLERKQASVHYDSCAASTTVSLDFVNKHGISVEKGNGGKQESISFAGFTDGTRTSSHTAVVEVTAGKAVIKYRCWVVEDAPVDILIGRDQMKAAEGKGVILQPDPSPGKGSVHFIKTSQSISANSAPQAGQCQTATLLQTEIAEPSSRALMQIRTQHTNSILWASGATGDDWCCQEQLIRTDDTGVGTALVCSLTEDVEIWDAGKQLDIPLCKAFLSPVRATARQQTTEPNDGNLVLQTKSNSNFKDFRMEDLAPDDPNRPASSKEIKRGAN